MRNDDLEDVRVVTSNEELTAMFHPIRGVILDLTLERPASVNELAAALRRPPSTVAYHVKVLEAADLLTVVRTRQRRAITERFYGRTARVFYVGAIGPEQRTHVPNLLSVAASESVVAHDADELRAVVRHARLSDDQAETFWRRVFDLLGEFAELPPDGERSYSLAIGLYPSEHPTLPDVDDEEETP